MATNKHSDGNTIPYANSSGSLISSGDVVVILAGASGRCGIAADDIANGSTGDVVMEGVFELAAESGGSTAWAQGALLYWDGSQLTDTSSANDLIGYATEAKADGDTTAKVKLQG